MRFWSATPTPFHDDLSPDLLSVARLIERHILLHVEGIMLGGTCGEGPWMPIEDLMETARVAVETSRHRMRIAAQVTDNSARRMLHHIHRLASVGVEYAVVAAPYFLMNASPQNLLKLYLEVIRESPIPIGFYDRGKHSPYSLESDLLPELLSEPNVQLIKDSSGDRERQEIYLKIVQQRPDLSLFTGDEFHGVDALQAGYHGLLLGGGIFNARLAHALGVAVTHGNLSEAQTIQNRMNELMFRVYGGERITCWLTGLKYLLVRLGVFESTAGYLHYPLTSECRSAIDEIVSGSDKDGYKKDLDVPLPKDPTRV